MKSLISNSGACADSKIYAPTRAHPQRYTPLSACYLWAPTNAEYLWDSIGCRRAGEGCSAAVKWTKRVCVAQSFLRVCKSVNWKRNFSHEFDNNFLMVPCCCCCCALNGLWMVFYWQWQHLYANNWHFGGVLEFWKCCSNDGSRFV